ncbi:MAG: hypothetical protein GEU75_11930 [Dehalococcoidia bacterium]|nr:hypothetical protein [Dehalococcoidia bacterium]
MNRHEIPTHLNVEDKAFAGLTMRQLMTVAMGLGLAYGASNQLPLPMPLPVMAAAVVLAAVALAALWRPAGRPVEDWAFVLLRFWAIPRVAVWRVRRLDPARRAKNETYEVVLPEPAWSNESDGGASHGHD